MRPFAQNCSFQERWEDVSFVGQKKKAPWALQLSFPATLYNIKLDSMIFNFLLHLLRQNSKHHETSWKHARLGTWHFIRTVPPPAAVSLPAHVQWSHALRASGATPRLLAARNVRATQMAKACYCKLTLWASFNMKHTSDITQIGEAHQIDWPENHDHQTSLHRRRHRLLPFGSAFAQHNNL